MRRKMHKTDPVRPEGARQRPGSSEWIRALPEDLLEPHPLVQGLRQILEAKDAALADKDEEIARLEIALTFGLRRLPSKPST